MRVFVVILFTFAKTKTKIKANTVNKTNAQQMRIG